MSVTNSEIGAYVDSLSDIGTPAGTDELLVYDVSATTTKKVQASALSGSSDLDAIITASSGEDIADALAGAAAPDASNVFATMADVGGGGGGGGLVLLESHTASSVATLDFTTRNAAGQSGNTFQTDYDGYLIEIVELLPATNATSLLMKLHTSGGFSATGYKSNGSVFVVGGSAFFGSNTATEFSYSNAFDFSNVAGDGTVGWLRVYSPATALTVKKVKHEIGWITSTTPKNSTGFSSWHSTTAVDGFQFLFSSGNVASGIVRVYGFAS